jgi:putative transposase
MVEESSFEQQDVGHCCQILGVSRSGYYDWLHRPVSERTIEDQRIWEKIKKHWEKSRKTYGSPRILEKLKSEGESIGKHRVARIMRENGIQGAAKKKFKPQTTDSNHKLPVADRIFETENSSLQVQKPNQYWGGDITYIPTGEGWLYLAIVIDLFTRKIVGHSMKSSLHADIVINALEMGIQRQLPGKDLISHSDRGSQYAADEYRKLLKANNIKASMSRKGNCYDNAFVESFFHTLKVELVHRERFKTREEAQRAIFEYIEVWYNRQRIHSALDYKTPVEYELLNLNQAA